MRKKCNDKLSFDVLGFPDGLCDDVSPSTAVKIAGDIVRMRRDNSNQDKMNDDTKVGFRIQTTLEVLDDGYRWRKYGKKNIKCTPNPRNYYRCSTIGCKVKKRVERDRDDSSYMLATYIGQHNHEVPSTTASSSSTCPTATGVVQFIPANWAGLVAEGYHQRVFRQRKYPHRNISSAVCFSSMSVVYVLTTPMLEDGGENPTVEQVRRRAKWDSDDYVCRGLILNGMSDSLFYVYQNIETSKELWDTLKAKYMAEDVSSKKFLASNFTNYKKTDSRPVLEQYNELLKILGSHLRIEESLRVQDSDKPKGNNVFGPSVVNRVEHNNSSTYNDNKGKQKHHDTKADPNKKPKDDDVAWWVDSGATVHVCKDRCWFKTYESLNDGSILDMGNESTALAHGRSCVDLRASTSSNKGPRIVSLRILFAALNEHDKVFDNVDMTKAENEGKTGVDVTKVVAESNSDVDDVYDESAQYMASSHHKVTSVESNKGGSKSLYERSKESHDEYLYNYEACDITIDQMAFCGAWNINLRGQIGK
uniref:Zinc finger, CCHC-type n=1 Tax=Tanacetum cinerariifolium TaxID=118510 RepID=A0A6L2JUI3_TANCI|nr:zinc finger, CCHC-type [Tanacetum cinerariifolium]